MTDQSLTASIRAAMKAAMKARDKDRLGTIRLIQAEFKRIEVDERIEVDDARALAVLDKMVKQRRDSAQQYADAGRDELAEKENAEIAVLQEFLPQQLSEDEIIALIDEAIAASGAEGMAAMGPVMGQLKPKLAGRADMGAVSGLVKQRLSA
ncbi:GatB/YqeY domain-containing protein [Pseudohalioglobus sediminis]|uniref:GatB/YqeY domain-containing protein n=1 Tax=Pseudohalioglobus sediminis TaxID=2606449 RepID=A0A5B0WYC2_9GAMM|nr:GatB/YqeY domain-containing protein [Pseudohalioglobus sediminis]KAA1192023.1 GatB/YqeY domain-containing protein [Pseudohalioglobus sediminis]